MKDETMKKIRALIIEDLCEDKHVNSCDITINIEEGGATKFEIKYEGVVLEKYSKEKVFIER